MDAWLKTAAQLYAAVYFGGIVVLALIEWIAPRRAAGDLLRLRWAGNFGITVLSAVAVRLLFPLVGVGWAVYCAERGWGVFNLAAPPLWLSLPATILLMDLAIYTEHAVYHRVPLLWRVHRTHHTDLEYDFTTSTRFHPIENLLTTSATLAVVALLGPPPLAALIAQIASTAQNFLEHANVRVPEGVDRLFRTVFVTPDMHRIHHSIDGRENRSNLANIFSFWDRLFGTYVHAPAVGQEAIVFGVDGFTERKHVMLHWMLAQPFLHPSSATVDADVGTRAPAGGRPFTRGDQIARADGGTPRIVSP